MDGDTQAQGNDGKGQSQALIVKPSAHSLSSILCASSHPWHPLVRRQRRSRSACSSIARGASARWPGGTRRERASRVAVPGRRRRHDRAPRQPLPARQRRAPRDHGATQRLAAYVGVGDRRNRNGKEGISKLPGRNLAHSTQCKIPDVNVRPSILEGSSSSTCISTYKAVFVLEQDQ